MAAFLDGCRFNPTAGGTTDWTYSSPVTGYQSPAAAGVVNGTLYKYRAESADLSQWELGEGAYNTSTGVLARTTVLFNSSATGAGSGQSGAGTKISFSAVPQVAIIALAEDLPGLALNNAFSGNNTLSGTQNVTNTTDATSTTAGGAINTAGGVAVAKSVWAAKVNVGAATTGASTLMSVAGRAVFTAGAPDPNDGTPAGVVISFNTASQYGTIDAIQTGISGKSLRLNCSGQGPISTYTIQPLVDNNQNCGGPSNRWANIYAASGTVNSSNALQKTALADIDPGYLLAALDTPLGQYQWLSAIDAKGADKARIHFGTTAQAFRDACIARGVDPKRFAGYCEDAVTAEVKKTRTVSRQKMADISNVTSAIVIQNGKPVLNKTTTVTTQGVVEMVPVTDEGGAPVMADENTPLLHPMPVMEDVTEDYFDIEPTGEITYGLRYDQFDRLLGYARWLIYSGKLAWMPQRAALKS